MLKLYKRYEYSTKLFNYKIHFTHSNEWIGDDSLVLLLTESIEFNKTRTIYANEMPEFELVTTASSLVELKEKFIEEFI